ncbi:hypothetical protein Rmet_6479 [Cupriavidus metallidurans CH34]|uniref:Uncharacterized protein n=1 Tax=Cupriavidus metallidurans (strain ATCC 43123 / DSM 2839 / NBRC 102507 / CH34) TaxID=266264 RepID=D3DXR7_CUPMC|nr:hypothetical protein Rmet_6479 [Cupriavidus metallidurans CH34]
MVRVPPACSKCCKASRAHTVFPLSHAMGEGRGSELSGSGGDLSQAAPQRMLPQPLCRLAGEGRFSPTAY